MLNKKHTGSYYTPSWLSDYIVKYLYNNNSFTTKIKALEPSCGDGVFVNSMCHSQILKNIDSLTISDINGDALNEASQLCNELNIIKKPGDFLNNTFNDSYNLIIGNPPYIDKKYLSEEQKESYAKWHEEAGIKNRRVHNIWPSFIYKSETLLEKDGVLAFVIPEELLRVNYAKETLNFLQDKFKRLEIFSLNKVIFGDAGQKTVVVIGYKKHINLGTYLGRIVVDGTSQENYTISKKQPKIGNINYKGVPQKELGTELTLQELQFIADINKNIKTIDNFSKSQTGIVTGANDFFILSEEDKNFYNLDEVATEIVRKGNYIKDSLKFTKKKFSNLVNQGKPCFLLEIRKDTQITDDIMMYLQKGKDQKIHKRYKCGTYKPNWYNIPSIWTSKLLFFKRSHIAPKLIYNTSGANITDSGYRIELHDEGFEKEFQYCFYNSFTLLMMEVGGRSYGGGVLEVTPNEFKKLPIPFLKNIPKDNLKNFYKKDLSQIDEVLLENDEYILKERMGFSEKKVLKIKKLRDKLIKKRLKK